MKRNLLFVSPILAAGAIALAGCGGSGSAPVTVTKGASLSGTATVPSGTPTRAAASDIAFPGATVNIYDITKSGSAALTGTPTATTTTASDGTFTVTGLTAGDNFIIKISKQVTVNGATVTISLGGYVNIPTTTTTVPVQSNVNTSSTVATNLVIQQISSGAATVTVNLSTLFTQFVQTVIAEIQAGTAPTIDLTKSFSDPNAFTTVITQVKTAGLKTASFYDDGPTSGTSVRNNTVLMNFNKTAMQVMAVLLVRDTKGAIFDADYYTGTVDQSGNFSGTTVDGLYTIKGSMYGKVANGSWAAVSGATKGSWEAAAVAAPNAYQSAGYTGSFTENGSSAKTGMWSLFVGPDGSAILFAHDDARTDLAHLLKTAVVTGTVSTAGAVTGNLAFPVTAGTITGTDPAQNGTAAGTGSGTAGGKTGNGTTSLTGTISGSTVSGTYSFIGIRTGHAFTATGAWNGTRISL